jgi:hydroxymethylpyrimidine/phosphomethylpyrimidine kinase
MAVITNSKVLVVAGSDSSGGAGIARDVAAVAHFGVAASLAVTALTVQTHVAVTAIESVVAGLIADQMRAALTADRIAAVKIGMVSTAEAVDAIANVLADHPEIPVVLDPVLASTSGTLLTSELGIERLKQRLMPASALITPNLPELAILSEGEVAQTDDEIARQAALLLKAGCRDVLVKGGHGSGIHSIDTLYTCHQPPRHFASTRSSARLRGTGCMLSAAIAACLANGHDVVTAISFAKAYIDERFCIQQS